MKRIVNILVGVFGGVYLLVMLVLAVQLVSEFRAGQPLGNLAMPVGMICLLAGGAFASWQFVNRRPGVK